MSEHHARDRDRHSAVVELLSAKRCGLWPDCACRQTLAHWQHLLTTTRRWEFENLSWADTSIFLTLSCVAERCPERRIRTYAQVQLLSPWWNRQRLGEELTEEFCEEVRARYAAR